jgi:hypothetical protein
LRGPGCCKLFPRKSFNAEVLDINELRVYHARNVDEAAALAAEEFGEDNIGRVYPKL